MSPKNTVHGGPTHRGDPPPPSRRSFGAALAAARADTPAAPSQVNIVIDGSTSDVTEFLREQIKRIVRVEGAHGPEVELATGGVLSAEQIPAIGETGPELTEIPDGATVHPNTVDTEGGEPPSAGSSSSTSPKKQPTKRAPTKAPNRPRARTTANPSKPDPEADSTAGSADAPTTTSASDPSTFPQSTES